MKIQKYMRIGVEVEAFQFDGTTEQLKSNGVPYDIDDDVNVFLVYNDDYVMETDWLVTQDGFKTLEVVSDYVFKHNYEPLDKYHNLHSAGMSLDAFYDDFAGRVKYFNLNHVRKCLNEINDLIDYIESEAGYKK